MLECRACLRHCLRALASAHTPNPRVRTFSTASALAVREKAEPGRFAGTRSIPLDKNALPGNSARARAAKLDAPARPIRKSFRPGNFPAARPKDFDALGNGSERTNGHALQTSTTTDDKDGKRIAALRRELQYLQDPLKLAQYVRSLLERDDVDKALALTQMSSKALSNTVSWNHIIDWHMKMGNVSTAFKVYNDMKKRAQKPDSYTYLLLLRGLADHASKPQSLGRALTLYHAMSAPGNKAVPSIIHTNAVLKVCARAEDMESVWDIVQKLPKEGPHAPNSWTYTTILNSMRQRVAKPLSLESEEEHLRRTETVILEARQLWMTVVKRWRGGDLKLDEELVCAMGHLLLSGARPRDWDDVLSLVQQSMNVPRLVPRLGTEAREKAGLPRIRAPNTPSDLKNDNSEIQAPFDEAPPGSEFDAFRGQAAGLDIARNTNAIKRRDAHNYARPGNNTLSLVLEACLKTVAKNAATQYWELFTGAHNIRPDLDNFNMMLRVLRQSHSCAEAVTLVREEMSQYGLVPQRKTYRIAMSACVRDFGNPNRVELAGRLLDHMKQTDASPDAATMGQYLSTASRTEDSVAISRALDRLYEPARRVQSERKPWPAPALAPALAPAPADHSAQGQSRAPPSPPRAASTATTSTASAAEHKEVVSLLRHMISCFDRVKDDGAKLDEAQRKKYQLRSKEFGAYVTRLAHGAPDAPDWRERRRAKDEVVRWRRERRAREAGAGAGAGAGGDGVRAGAGADAERAETSSQQDADVDAALDAALDAEADASRHRDRRRQRDRPPRPSDAPDPDWPRRTQTQARARRAAA